MKIYWLTTGNHFSIDVKIKEEIIDTKIKSRKKDFSYNLYSDNELAIKYFSSFYALLLKHLILTNNASIGATISSRYYLKLSNPSNLKQFTDNIGDIETGKPLSNYDNYVCFDHLSDITNFIDEYNKSINSTYIEPSIIF